MIRTVLMSLGAIAMACSGSNASTDGAAGSGAGTSLPGQANATLVIQKGVTNCPTPGKTYELGNPRGPTSTSVGDVLIDGEQGASVTCSVQGRGPFTFSATIRGTSGVSMTISDGVIDADGLNGTAMLDVYTPDLAATYTSGRHGCGVTVVNQQVKPGAMWATLLCPTIASASTAQSCTVGAGSTFVLENCAGS